MRKVVNTTKNHVLHSHRLLNRGHEGVEAGIGDGRVSGRRRKSQSRWRREDVDGRRRSEGEVGR